MVSVCLRMLLRQSKVLLFIISLKVLHKHIFTIFVYYHGGTENTEKQGEIYFLSIQFAQSIQSLQSIDFLILLSALNKKSLISLSLFSGVDSKSIL